MKKPVLLALMVFLVLSVIQGGLWAKEASSPGKNTAPLSQDHSAKDATAEKGHSEGENLGTQLPLWTVLPFAGILLSIALFPLLAPSFWHHHYPKVSAFWAVAFAVPFIIAYRGVAVHSIAHIYIIDYIPFIILLWSLFTISGGILVRGTLKGSPAVNTLILLIGTLLASWIGTTGASMLLIRPILRSNSWRVHKVHTIVFFIFLVSNIGGSLTPLGDPPLFLGFLHGVEFFWTFKLLPHMAFATVILLTVYFAMDTFFYRKENPAGTGDIGEKEPLRIEGWHNFFFLGGVVGGVLLSGLVKMGEVNIFGIHQTIQNLVKDVLLIAMGVCSMVLTKKSVREANEFGWGPIKEVAYLFAGIFMTIIPALAILQAGSKGSLAFIIDSIKTPAHYFWVTGALSSFLDNAPTYLTFFNSAIGKFLPDVLASSGEPAAVKALMSNGIAAGTNFRLSDYLLAISAGAVFMGANTYIGNAPNFMVKSIAEESGVAMPSFFGYMFKYSIPILVVTFIIITFIFF